MSSQRKYIHLNDDINILQRYFIIIYIFILYYLFIKFLIFNF